MNEVIKKLLVVQELDVKIIALKEKLAEGPSLLAEEEAELEKHRTSFEEASRRAKEAMRIAERKNADVDAVDQKIRDLRAKQNTARTNKEYEAFKMEIAGQNADREILEEEALQQWSVGEDREKEAEMEAAKVKGMEDQLAQGHLDWEERAVELNRELDEFLELRKTKIVGLPPTWISSYERLLESQGVPVLVQVVDQYCQGCQMSMSIHDVTRAWKASEVVKCRACNRILYAETL